MKLIYRIAVAHFIIVLILAALFAIQTDANMLLGLTGFISVIFFVIDIVIALFLFAFKKNELAKGFLLSAGILLLVGFTFCSSIMFAI